MKADGGSSAKKKKAACPSHRRYPGAIFDRACFAH